MFFPNDPTQNNTEWHVSEEPRARLGKGVIGQIRYSPDGMQLAVGSSIGVWIYNAYTGKELNLLTGHIKGPGLIAYSPDGHTLASGGTVWPELIAYSLDGSLYAGTICLWNLHTGEHKVTLGEHEGRVTCVEFSPDGSILATGSVVPRGDGTIRLWDVVTGKCIATLEGDTGGCELMVFSPDGKTLASSGEGFLGGVIDGEAIQVWDTETGQQKFTLENNPNSSCFIRSTRIQSIAFSPDGSTIVGGGRNIVDERVWSGSDDWTSSPGIVQLWDAATGEHQTTLINGHTAKVRTVAYSPDGSFLVSGSDEDTFLWDTGTDIPKAVLTAANPYAIAFSPDSNTLAIAGKDKRIRLWDTVSGEHKLTLTEHTDGVYDLIFNPDGKTFAGIGEDSTIRLWDAIAGEYLQTITGHTRSVSSISFNPDGSTLATGSGQNEGGSGDKRIRIWNVQSGDLQDAFKVPEAKWIDRWTTGHVVDFVSYSPDGKTLASVSNEGAIRLWDAESGKLQFTTFDGFRGVPTEKLSGGYGMRSLEDPAELEAELQVLETEERKNLWTIGGFVLAYSPDGKTLATSSRKDQCEDTTIQLWDAVTCKHKAELIGRETRTSNNCIACIAFSPDGRTVAGGSHGMKLGRAHAVYLWDAITGELKTTLTGKAAHGWAPVRSVAFSPDGRTLAYGVGSHGSGKVYLWDVVTGEYKACLHSGSSFSNVAFSPDSSALAVGGKEVTVWDAPKILQRSTSDNHDFYISGEGYEQSGFRKATLKGHTDWVNAVAFSPDGRTLATGGNDGAILFWDITKTPQSPKQIARYALPRTVSVGVYKGGRPGWSVGVSKLCQGSGFFIRHDLVVICRQLWAPSGLFAKLRKYYSLLSKNRTIKESQENIWVTLPFEPNGVSKYSVLPAHVVAVDPWIAILQLDLTYIQNSCRVDFDIKVQAFSLSYEDDFHIGDTVYVAGRPRIFSQGIISSIRNFWLPIDRDSTKNRRLFGITAQIPEGFHGGPVLNKNGQLIGITVRNVHYKEKHSLMTHDQNATFAIPSSYIRELLSEVDTSD